MSAIVALSSAHTAAFSHLTPDLPSKTWDQKATGWLDKNIPINFPIGKDWYNGNNAPSINPDRIEKFNIWLDAENKNIGVTAVKIIPKILRTILILVYHTIKFSTYALLHPCKAMVKVSKFLVSVLHAIITKPELWTNVGAGLIGASLGGALVTGGLSALPSEIGSIIGFSMIGFGLVFGAIKSACCAKSGERWKEVKHMFTKQIEELPESFLTGMAFGAIFGGIEKVQKVDSSVNNVLAAADDLPVIASTIDAVPLNVLKAIRPIMS